MTISSIKKLGKNDDFVSQEEYERRIREIVKCKRDIQYFAENYYKTVSLDEGLIQIKLYDVQKDLLKSMQSENRLVTLSSRQCGKSTMYCIYTLWATCFFQDKKILILAHKAATALEIMSRIERAYQELPNWLKPSVLVYNKGEIIFGNNSGIKALASSSDQARGFSANCVTGNTKVTIVDDDGGIWYTDIDKVSDKANSSKVNKKEMTDELAMKYNFIYKIINLINNKEYIGIHSTNDLNDGYMGSGVFLQKAFEKYGIKNFKREILEFFNTRQEAFKKERELVNEDYIRRHDTYNVSLGGGGNVLYKPEIAVVINGITYPSYFNAQNTLKLYGKKLMELVLQDGNGFVDVKRQQQLKEKYIELLKEQEINHQHHLEALRIANKNPERNKKISETLTGKKHWWQDKVNKNPEKIRKMAEKHKGMKRSEEAKQHISEARKKFFDERGGVVFNKGKIWITNIETGVNKYVSKNEPIPDGWKLGLTRKCKF